MMQREVPTNVWGFDLVGSIDAELSCQVLGRVVSHKLTTVRSMEGVWEAELPSQLAGTLCDFQATSETEDIVLTDIMFGDIWLCSGQSNMEMAMRFIMNATEEIEADAEFKSCMINLHLGFRTLTKDQLRGHITYFEQLFTSFASKIDEFNSLGTSDQGWIYQSS